jgi:hypothetical protein
LSSGTEFATCPIPEGERAQAVEPATDSSRYFVLRLMDLANPQRRAFVGLGFTDRAEAFDFNVALVGGARIQNLILHLPLKQYLEATLCCTAPSIPTLLCILKPVACEGTASMQLRSLRQKPYHYT